MRCQRNLVSCGCQIEAAIHCPVLRIKEMLRSRYEIALPPFSTVKVMAGWKLLSSLWKRSKLAGGPRHTHRISSTYLTHVLMEPALGLVFRTVLSKLFMEISARRGDNGPPIGKPSGRRYFFLLKVHRFFDAHRRSKVSNSLIMSSFILQDLSKLIINLMVSSTGIFVYISLMSKERSKALNSSCYLQQ